MKKFVQNKTKSATHNQHPNQTESNVAAAKYRQKVRSTWFKDPRLKSWMLQIESVEDKVECRYCKIRINARLCDLVRHADSGNHKAAAAPFSDKRQARILFTPVVSRSKSTMEGRLAMYVACHQAIYPVDHLGELITSTTNVTITLHRTKCSNIIQNILGPHFEAELREDIGEQWFSILIDESNDISNNKLLGVVIVYYSISHLNIISTFLGFVCLTVFNAQGISDAVKFLLNQLKLNLQKLLAIGTDNASVMIGVNKGVYSILKKEIPNLILIKCVCHSLQLAMSSAAKTLPKDIEYLLRETYNWFSHSSLRLYNLRTLYQLINEGTDPLSMPQISNTRWSSRTLVVSRVLAQWLELKTVFQIESANCTAAGVLASLYTDISKSYLVYIKPILSEVDQVNKAFQSKVADASKLLNDLMYLIKSLARKIVPGADFDKIDFFSTEITSYIDIKANLGLTFEQEIVSLPLQEQETVRANCIAFTKDLIDQLVSRLPENIKVLRHMSIINIDSALANNKKNTAVIIDLAKLFDHEPEKLQMIETQWCNLTNVKWQSKTTKDLWIEISNYRDSVGENPYANICELALKLLSLPHSNGDVERVFSQVNIVKNKLRNKMSLGMLNAILQIRFGLQRNQKCCNSYNLPESAICQIGTLNTYA